MCGNVIPQYYSIDFQKYFEKYSEAIILTAKRKTNLITKRLLRGVAKKMETISCDFPTFPVTNSLPATKCRHIDYKQLGKAQRAVLAFYLQNEF